MNRKQLTIILILGVVVGGFGWYLNHRNAESWQGAGAQTGRKLLANFPLNDVAQITIKQGQSELTLAQKNDLWTVRERYDYPANFTEIGDLLRKVWELKVVQSEMVGPSQLPRLELIAPGKGTNSGTLVEFKDKAGKTLKSMLLGKKHMRKSETPSPYGGEDGYPDGRYVLAADESKDVAIISDPLTTLDPKPEPWLNKDFFKVEKLRSVSVTSTNAAGAWKVSRDTEIGEMKLADAKANEKLDTAKIGGVSSALSYPSFNDIVSPTAKPEETGLNQPIVATLDTFDEFHYTVKIGKANAAGDYPIQMSVTAEIPKQRTPGKDEKPADKEKLDKEFKDKNDKLEQKLKQEKTYEKWDYLA